MTGLDCIMVFVLCIGITVIAAALLNFVVTSVYLLISDAIISRKGTKKRYVIHYESFGERYDVFYARSEEQAIKQFKKRMGSRTYSILDIIEKSSNAHCAGWPHRMVGLTSVMGGVEPAQCALLL